MAVSLTNEREREREKERKRCLTYLFSYTSECGVEEDDLVLWNSSVVEEHWEKDQQEQQWEHCNDSDKIIIKQEQNKEFAKYIQVKTT